MFKKNAIAHVFGIYIYVTISECEIYQKIYKKKGIFQAESLSDSCKIKSMPVKKNTH